VRIADLAPRGRGLLRRGELELEGWVASVPFASRAFASRRRRELSNAWQRECTRPSLDEEVGIGDVAYSQNDEDSILAGIFEQLGSGNRFFVEIGASDGTENCTRNLAENGWSGVWIEGDPLSATRAREVAPKGVVTVAAGVTPANVVTILHQESVPSSPDLLVLDIDGNDWWVVRSLLRSFSPRVLVVEYNGAFRPGEWWRLRYRDNRLWDHTFRYGASLQALHSLLKTFGYGLVGCDSRGVNGFFIRKDVVDGALARRIGPPSLHYRAPAFSLFAYGHARSRRVFRPMLALSQSELMKIDILPGAQLSPQGPVPGGSPIFVQACIRNGGQVPLTSGPPAGVNISLKVFDADGALVEAMPRTPLPCPVRPGRTVIATLSARAPLASGRYFLETTLVQEWNAWFTDVSGENRSISMSVEVA
jgi:hypothetical protein